MESLQEDPNKLQQQVNKETTSEASEIITEAENDDSLDKKETSEPLQIEDSLGEKETLEPLLQTDISGSQFMLFAFVAYQILGFFWK